MLSFLSTAEKSQTGNNNFRNKQILRVAPVLKVTIIQSTEAELTTISVAVVASTW